MEELITYMQENFYLTDWSKIEFKKALEKEKEQIIDAVNNHDLKCVIQANKVISNINNDCKIILEHDNEAGNKYYNQTFNK